MKLYGYFFWGLLVSIVVASSALNAEIFPKPQEWLEKMVSSQRNLSYKGDFVYQQGGRLETLNVLHHVKDKKEKERILFLDGRPREMIRSGNQLTFANYNQGVTRFEHGSLMPMIGKFAGEISEKNYKLNITGIDRVAGREAILMMIIPKDRFRYGYQLWLDRATGLLLKSLMIDDNGKVMEQLQFTRLEVGEEVFNKKELAVLEKRELPADRVITMNSPSGQKDVLLKWEAGWIPGGFKLENRSKRPSPVSEHEVDALIFSDGMASFSVFVEPDKGRILSQSSENIGALAAVSKIYRDDDEYYHVTVVGEVPLSTAERVAVSVRPNSKNKVKNTKKPS